MPNCKGPSSFQEGHIFFKTLLDQLISDFLVGVMFVGLDNGAEIPLPNTMDALCSSQSQVEPVGQLGSSSPGVEEFCSLGTSCCGSHVLKNKLLGAVSS